MVCSFGQAESVDHSMLCECVCVHAFFIVLLPHKYLMYKRTFRHLVHGYFTPPPHTQAPPVETYGQPDSFQ